jgi:hypothetical protein
MGPHVGEVLRHRSGLPVRVHRTALAGQRWPRRRRPESVRPGCRRPSGGTGHFGAARMGPAITASDRADREPGMPCAAAQPQRTAGRPVRGHAAGTAGEHVGPVLAAPERPQPAPGAGGARVCRPAATAEAAGAGAGGGRGSGLGGLGAALAQHLDSSRLGQKGPAQPDAADGALAGRRASRGPGSRASGRESCARPGLPPSTACASATTPKTTTPCETASGIR